ncbi:MAG: response regulator transcription factor [Candidatus Obscuribacterales bacterium]|nr:response regulator transcription factor [Candidatus Obscuribacterales bacterium]
MAKILLVEDDLQIAETVSNWLKSEHFEVIHCDDGADASYRLKAQTFDLGIFDWELPGMSGLDLCRNYRASQGAMPILMLTGKDSMADKIAGLDVGADDYLTKPFSLKELSARVRALLRRPAVVVSNVLELGSLRLDTQKHRLTKDGAEIQLMPRDFALLEFFMRNPDIVFSSEALLNRVWNDESEAGSDALRTSIKRLRKKLDSGDNEADSVIENIPRVGYRFRLPK